MQNRTNGLVLDVMIRPTPKYYPSIDGLRALAVIAVIINHFDNTLLPSGYLGVDIFFVISGFVITSSLANRKDKTIGQFLAGFYTRRFKRIVPALVLCVICTSILISLFNPEPNAQLKTGIASLFGLSNISLYFNAVDYWGESAKLNPFTHTWSLGVEEQFYLIFPLMVWLTVFGRWTDKGHRHLKWLVGTFCLTSLAGFIYGNEVNQPAAYFLMPFRFWELGIGCLLFLILNERESSKGKDASKVMTPIVVIALVAALFLPLEFTVQATVIVVLLTVLLIACLRMQIIDSSLLSHPFMVYIGLISYSLYLWHWTVIVISRWTIGIHWWSAPFQIGITLLLAIASYRFVEKPLRNAEWLSTKIKLGSWGAVTALCLAFITIPSLTSANNSLYLGVRKEKFSNFVEKVQCGTSRPQSVKQIIRTIGDSHSIHIKPMLDVIAKKCDLTIIRPENYNSLVIPNGRHKSIDKITEVFKPLNPGDILILSSRNKFIYTIPFLNLKGDHWYDYTDAKDTIEDRLKIWLAELDSVLALAKNKGVNTVLFLPNVEFDQMVLPLARCEEQWFQISSHGCNPSVSMEFLKSRFPERFFEEINKRAGLNDNFYIFDPLPIYCGHKKDCSRRVNGVLAFNDTNHLSREGAFLMLEPFNSFLNEHHLLK